MQGDAFSTSKLLQKRCGFLFFNWFWFLNIIYNIKPVKRFLNIIYNIKPMKRSKAWKCVLWWLRKTGFVFKLFFYSELVFADGWRFH
jgi:hypothetical protein